MTKATGTFVWFEYVTADIAKAQGFYGELFHWKTQQVPMLEGYTMITLGDQNIGGYMQAPPGAPPIGHWISSLRTKDASDTCEQIKKLGGKVLKDPTKAGEVGVFAIVADPQGGVFRLWEPKGAPGSGDYKELPGAWCWNELAAHDPVRAVAFYTQLGFTEEKMDMPGFGTYHVLSSDGKPRAGVMKTPMPDAPQAWMPYVQVTNVDETVAKAQKLGAQITMQPDDVPMVGRIAIFTDPLGGWIGVLAPEKT